MVTVTAIRTEKEYETALARMSQLMDVLSPPEGQIEDENHPARIELELLSDLIEAYEYERYPIGQPSPIGAIELNMDRLGLAERDLIPAIGSRLKVEEVLTGKREITTPMAQALSKLLDIPVDILLQKPGAANGDAATGRGD